MGGLPKDERSRVCERGERGAVLQRDWSGELGGPAAARWTGYLSHAATVRISSKMTLPEARADATEAD